MGKGELERVQPALLHGSDHVLPQWRRVRDPELAGNPSVTALLVVGAGPGVGTTKVCAAVAALAVERSAGCTVVQPAETGVADGAEGSLATVARLAQGARTVELTRFPDRLPPAAAARWSGRPALDPAVCAEAVLSASRDGGLAVVDASGGLLVRYDDDGSTPAALARTLRLPVVVVAGAGDGAVNATALTLEAAASRGLALLGVVLGRWPVDPGPAERSAVDDLEMLAARPLLGALPPASCDPGVFREQARTGLGPALGGAFDAAAFRRRARS
ncbi:MAG: Dethiobiotin synthetase [uncultured Frankineae bacterium]|uniref:ATP-dependent dethiobiotin synthetase BioD n=1 Tax=uncultured Frankineae bacterium TaxID=437475 RepID=A0A6J4ME99_9ACTN|nr:MAG: Dethiobiotin synthetase [uncultured Frankineae bacterium]